MYHSKFRNLQHEMHTADTRFVSDYFSASRDARACALMSPKKSRHLGSSDEEDITFRTVVLNEKLVLKT